MANLTDYLPAVMNGKDVQRPYDPGPSLFESLAKAFDTGNQMLTGAAKTRAAREEARRQAEKDALEASDRGAKNFAAQAELDISQLSHQETATPPAPQDLPDVYAGLSQDTPSIINAPDPSKGVPLTQDEITEITHAQAKGAEISNNVALWQSGVQQGRMSPQQYELLV